MVPRFTATIKLKGGRTFQQRHGYFKIAYRWVMEWQRKTVVLSAEIFDLDRTETAWTSTEGLLLKYRTVEPEDAPPFFRPNVKPNYTGSGSIKIGKPTNPAGSSAPRYTGVGSITRSLPHK